jgi:hypothetical protein
MDDSIFKVAKLKGSANYDIWAIRIESILIREDLNNYIRFDYLDTIGEEDLEPEARKATSLIKLSLEDGPLLQTKTVDNPFLLWEQLKTLYSSKGFTSEFLLSQELITITLDNYKGNLESYIDNFKRVINNLEAKNIILPRKFIIALLLNNLNKSYDQIVAIITQSIRMDNTDSITLDEILAQLLDEFRRLTFLKPNNSYTSNNTSDSINNKPSKTIENTLQTNKRPFNKKGIICNFCSIKGHVEKDCRKKQAGAKSVNNSNKPILTTSTNKDNSNNTIDFILDSGATVHCCYIKDLFTFVKPTTISIKWGNTSSVLKAEGISNISIYLSNNRVELENVLFIPKLGVNLPALNLITARNYTFSSNKDSCCLYTPKNTLFAKGQYKAGVTVFKATSNKPIKATSNKPIKATSNKPIKATSNKPIKATSNKPIKATSNKPIKVAKALLNTIPTIEDQDSDNLDLVEASSIDTELEIDSSTEDSRYNYINLEKDYISTKSPSNSSTIAKKVEKIEYNSNSIELLHNRLAHPNIKAIKSLKDNALGATILEKNFNTAKVSLENCIPCIQAKLTKNVSKKPSTKVEAYLDLIYIDIGGPISPKTYKGYKYYIAFKDSFSKYLEVRLLKSRSNIVKVIKDVVTALELEAYNNNSNTSNKLKALQFDNEFISKDLTNWLITKGIKIRLTSPYSSEQNGAIEIVNRILLNKVRAMLTTSNLSKEIWGEAIITATYLYNRTPNSSIDFKTPYYLKYSRLPNISNIRVFGSLAYYKEPLTKKLDLRASSYYLIGFRGDNSYKLYNSKTKKSLYARNYKIIEGYYYKPNNLDNISKIFTKLSNNQENTIELEDSSSSSEKDTIIPNRQNKTKKPIRRSNRNILDYSSDELAFSNITTTKNSINNTSSNNPSSLESYNNTIIYNILT